MTKKLPCRPCLLLVEDDQMVRETIILMLEDDYQVFHTASVSGALTWLQTSDGPAIDVVLLDCLLPDGKVTNVLEVTDQRSIPAVLISGDPRQTDMLAPNRVFLAKPFSQAALLKILDSARG